jgi:hypothetical protein
VLDLEPGVHLEECGFAAAVDQELAGPRAHVADRSRQGQGRSPEPGAEGGIDAGRRRLLEHLLVASLDRAVALAEMDAVPVAIEEDLDLDVAAALDESLQDQPVVAEGPGRLAASGRERIREAGRITDGPHPLPATAGGRLDQQWIADRSGRGGKGGFRLVRAVVAGQHRDAERRRQPAGFGLVAHRPDRGRRRPDPRQPGRGDGLGEVGVLRQEPEPGMDRLGAGRPGRRHHGLDVEQVERVGAIGRGHDRRAPEPVACARDASRDLASIRDEQAPDRLSPPDRRLSRGRL